MKTVDLSFDDISLNGLLELAKQDCVLIRSLHGEDYVLEQTDVYDREAAMLSGSETFMSFLSERSIETDAMPLQSIQQNIET